ncbi:hypothetical protein DMENIID0001_168430 [Sergentomyia squamirostris]
MDGWMCPGKDEGGKSVFVRTIRALLCTPIEFVSFWLNFILCYLVKIRRTVTTRRRQTIYSRFKPQEQLFFIPFEAATRTNPRGHLYKAHNNFKLHMGLTKPHRKKYDVTEAPWFFEWPTAGPNKRPDQGAAVTSYYNHGHQKMW